MGKGLIIGIIIAVIVILIFIFSFGSFGSERTTSTDSEITNGNDLPELEGDELGTGIGTPPEVLMPNTVEMSSSGFSPSSLTINAGDTVTFLAISSNIWPASDIHPTHRNYPGSDISKCNTAEADNIFDACRGIPNGNSYSFTFTEVGTWNYHNHFSPGRRGTIIVQ